MYVTLHVYLSFFCLHLAVFMYDWLKTSMADDIFFFAHLIVGAGAGSGQQKKTGSGKKKTGSGTYHLVIYIYCKYNTGRIEGFWKRQKNSIFSVTEAIESA